MKITCIMKSIITLMIFCSLGNLSSCSPPQLIQSGLQSPAAEQTVPLRADLIRKPQQSCIKITKQPASMPEWSTRILPSVWKELRLADMSAAVRVPADWVLSPRVPGQLSYYWLCRAPERKDKTATTLLIAVVTPPDKPVIEDGLRDTLQGIKRTRPNWSNEIPEWGTIAGKPFLRCYWRGEAAGRNIETASGVTYVTVITSLSNRKSLLIFSAQDLKQYAGKTIPEVERFICSTLFSEPKLSELINKSGAHTEPTQATPRRHHS